ncbi:MAG: dockerin type I domain-containing protein, partial [Tepidisphaeraceae bacterium]
DLSNANSDMGESLAVSGGTVTLGGNVNVGGSGGGASGTGVLTVSAAGILTIGGTLTAFNSGSTSVNLSGGTINVAALNLNGDLSLLNWTGGTLNFTNGLTVGSGGALGSNVTVTSGQTLGVTNAGTLNVSGTLNVNGGTLNAGTVNLSGSYAQTSGAATLGQITGFGGITISGGKTTLAPGSGVSQIGSLTIALGGTAQLDITNNTLAINFSSPSTDPAAMIRLYLQSGYHNDAWTGSGIVSSIAAGNAGLYAVGYADGNVDAGTPAGTNQILIENTLAGDANLDGTVNFADLLVVAQNFNHLLDTHGNTIDWADGDFNYDGVVNFADLLLVAQNFNKTLSAGEIEQLPGSFDAAWNLALADVRGSESENVPEPLSSSLVAAGAAAMLLRRQRFGRVETTKTA